MGQREQLPRVTGLKRTASLGDTWPIFQSSVEVMVHGHTKPPRLGPSNISATGMSPAGMLALALHPDYHDFCDTHRA